MTDLKDQLARLLDDEPEAPYDIDRVVRSGRRARGRHNAAVAAAGTIGVIGVTAAVVVPLMATGDHGTSVSVAVRPSPSPAAGTTHCYLISTTPKNAKSALSRLIRSGRVGTEPSVKTIRVRKAGVNKTQLEVCSQGSSVAASGADAQQTTPAPAGPPYAYTEKPATISSRL